LGNKKSKNILFEELARGFTLVEVLLVLALVGVMAGLTMGGLGGFFDAKDIHPPARRLKEAVLTASSLSEFENSSILLSYDGTSGGGLFLIRHKSKNSSINMLKIDERTKPDLENIPKISFQALPENGPSDYSFSDLELNAIEFHAGCSPPFQAVIQHKNESETIVFDPFSGYPVREEVGF